MKTSNLEKIGQIEKVIKKQNKNTHSTSNIFRDMKRYQRNKNKTVYNKGQFGKKILEIEKKLKKLKVQEEILEIN